MQIQLIVIVENILIRIRMVMVVQGAIGDRGVENIFFISSVF